MIFIKTGSALFYNTVLFSDKEVNMKSQIAFMFGAHCLAFLVVFPPGILGTFGLERKVFEKNNE